MKYMLPIFGRPVVRVYFSDHRLAKNMNRAVTGRAANRLRADTLPPVMQELKG